MSSFPCISRKLFKKSYPSLQGVDNNRKAEVYYIKLFLVTDMAAPMESIRQAWRPVHTHEEWMRKKEKENGIDRLREFHKTTDRENPEFLTWCDDCLQSNHKEDSGGICGRILGRICCYQRRWGQSRKEATLNPPPSPPRSVGGVHGRGTGGEGWGGILLWEVMGSWERGECGTLKCVGVRPLPSLPLSLATPTPIPHTHTTNLQLHELGEAINIICSPSSFWFTIHDSLLKFSFLLTVARVWVGAFTQSHVPWWMDSNCIVTGSIPHFRHWQTYVVYNFSNM